MADLGIKAKTVLPPHAGPGLICRLRQKQGDNGQRPRSAAAGEVELENASTDTLAIEWQMSPFQYLNLVVKDAAGTTVSDRFYGDCFSPLEKPMTLRLRPGEKYTGDVYLLGNVAAEKRLPGCYSVQAIFEYPTVQAVSEVIQIQYSDPVRSLNHNPS